VSCSSPAGANATYNVELRNGLGQTVGFVEDHVGESIELSDPLPPGTYVAVVTPFNRADVAGPVSTLLPFEVVAMTVTAPVSDVSTGLPEITWTSVDQTDHYELQLRESVSGLVLINETNLDGSVTSFTVASELSLGAYEVRVRAIEESTMQPGDWSAYQPFRVATAPVITAPVSPTADATPTIVWGPVPGASTYDVRINNVTEDLVDVVTAGSITASSYNVTPALPLGEYTVQVRGLTIPGVPGDWSTLHTFVVATPTTVNTPIARLPDSTPTFSWDAVPGADTYDVEITNAVSGQLVTMRNGLVDTVYTLPDVDQLPLGQYEVRVQANNLPAATSSGGTVSVFSAPLAFTVSTPPEVLAPNVGIYDTTPEITWTPVFGGATSEIEIVNAISNLVVFTQTGVVGTSLTVPVGGALTPDLYRTRVRSFGADGTASDWSTPHVFQVGTAPTLLGPSEGLGMAPFGRTELRRPTLTWQQSLAGETSRIWLTNVSMGETLYVRSGLQSSSYTPPVDLPVGLYRYWVQAETGLGEISAWSTPYDFEIVLAPTVDSISPRFDANVTVNWSHPDAANSDVNITWQLWLNKVNAVPAEIVLVEDGLTSTTYDLPSLPDGRYKVWTRGFVTGANPAAGTTVTSWSEGVIFETGGRPSVIQTGDTHDDTPLITWTPVLGAVSYQVYLASSSTISSPIVDESGITTTSYQVTSPLDSGDYQVWVRALAFDGRMSPWSLNSQSQFSVDRVTVPVLDQIATSSDRTPLFSWTATTDAVRYEIFVSSVSSTSVPVISDATMGGTSYTSTTQLTPGDYRYWVRAITSAGEVGAWSESVRFSIVSLDSEQELLTGDVLLVSAAEDAGWSSENLTQSVPARSLGDTDPESRSVAVYDDVAASILPLSDVSALGDDSTGEDVEASDEVMKGWDDAIWAEESAAVSDLNVSQQEQSTGRGWLAGLAMLTPSMLRRRRRMEREN
jgi:large repetitive protein